MWQAERSELEWLGFVILHRCGDGFYFLLACTWAGNNELWETVWAKDGVGRRRLPPLAASARGHHPTFCVWELGAVWHEQQAWSRFLRSEPRPEDVARPTSRTPTTGPSEPRRPRSGAGVLCPQPASASARRCTVRQLRAVP